MVKRKSIHLNNLNPFRKKIKYLTDEGKPQAVIRTGGASSKGITSKDRSIGILRKYWDYYAGEGTIFASINSITWNTVMSGYTLTSGDPEAKKLIQDLCDTVNLEHILKDAVTSVLVFGDAFIEMIMNKKKEVSRLKVVDSRTMIINADEFGDIIDYHQEIGGKELPPIDVENIIHLTFFNIPGSPYGMSLIAPNLDMIDRKVSTDESLFNAIKRHGTKKTIIYVGSEKDGQIPPPEVMDDIKAELEDINEKNEFVVPWFIKFDSMDEKGIEGVEEYFNYFQTQLIVGLLCPEEALGMGKGSTEACYDDKTETLTSDGWKSYNELTNDDLIATYNPTQDVLEYHKAIDDVKEHIYEHDGPMIHFKSQKIDMMVTPEHRMWVNKNPTLTNEKWEFVSAEEIYNSNSQWAIKSRTTREEPVCEDYPELENTMKFIGYFVSEGSVNKDSQYCRLSQKKEPSSKRIREVIYKHNPLYKESYSVEKGFEWHLYNKGEYKWLKQFGDDCYNRYIPREYINKDVYYLDKLLFAALDGDGTFDTREGRTNCEYGTTSKQLADNIQEIAIKCGYRSHIIFSEDNRGNRVGMWRVRIDLSNREYCVITPSMCEKVYYKGIVSCLNVPNHIYLTRRNNKVAIQGNTARIKAVMYERMIRSFQNDIAIMIRERLFNPCLEKNRFEPNVVKLKFNNVTEEDEALRAKWLGNLLRGFSEGDMPFTKNEIRAFFGMAPLEGMEDVPKKPDSEDTKPEKPEEEVEEEPEEEEEDNEDVT